MITYIENSANTNSDLKLSISSLKGEWLNLSGDKYILIVVTFVRLSCLRPLKCSKVEIHGQ